MSLADITAASDPALREYAVAPPPGNPRFPLLDPLRAVAALCIVVTHTAGLSGFNSKHWPGAWTARLDCGVAIFLPARSSGDWMESFTTRAAPPEVVPATRRTASPSVWAKALMAGFGPMKVASMPSASRASPASVPESKVEYSMLATPSRESSKKPSLTAAIAGAWVTFGK